MRSGARLTRAQRLSLELGASPMDHPKTALALAGALLTQPAWVEALQYADALFSAVAAFCGMVVGLYAVWEIRKRRPRHPRR